MYKHLLAAVFVSMLASFTIGCGGSGASVVNNPSGAYSVANLSGAYAFSMSGSNSYGLFNAAGDLTADGHGNITSGVLDLASFGGLLPDAAFAGSYTVSADGRGLAVINTSVQSFEFDFVILSSNRVLITRFESAATASGDMVLQNSSSFANTALTGPYAFNFAGADSQGAPLAMVGTATLNGSGGVTGGMLDYDDNGTYLSSQTIPSGTTYTISANGRGSLTLSTNLGAQTFAIYPIDGTHFKAVEVDGLALVAGDVYQQQTSYSNASMNGPFAFTEAGGLSAPFTAGGIFTANGNGSIAAGTEDINNSTSVSQGLSTTGTYSIATNGRGTMTLNNSAGSFSFVFYISNGGLQMLEPDGNLASGTGYASAPVTALSGRYGVNLSGVAINVGETDLIAQFTASSGNLNGATDINANGTLSQSLALSGSYSLPSSGNGTVALKASSNTFNLSVYPVSSSRFLFLELDRQQVSTGEFDAQQ